MTFLNYILIRSLFHASRHNCLLGFATCDVNLREELIEARFGSESLLRGIETGRE